MPACAATSSSEAVLTHAIGLVDCYTNNFVFEVYASTFGPGTQFATVLTGALVLYVAIYGLQLAMGRTTLTINEFGPRVLKIGFIVALLTVWGTFQRLVVDVAFGAPTGLANEMLSLIGTGANSQAGVIGAVDAFYDKMMDASTSYMRQASITALHFYFAAAFVWFVTIVVMLFAFGFMLVAKLATALILGVGPVFIALFLFGGTRGLFEGWLRSLLTFALVPLFLLTSMAMLLAIVTGTVDTIRAEAIAGSFTWDNIILLVVFTIGFALLFVQIPNITAGIAGGVSLGGVASTMTALGLGSVRAVASGGKTAGRAGALAYALRSQAARERTLPELRAAGHRAIAGIGAEARWWNRVGTTGAMRHGHLSKVLRDADRRVPGPYTLPSPTPAARSSGGQDNRS